MSSAGRERRVAIKNLHNVQRMTWRPPALQGLRLADIKKNFKTCYEVSVTA
jgi:hypothetical protein